MKLIGSKLLEHIRWDKNEVLIKCFIHWPHTNKVAFSYTPPAQVDAAKPVYC